MLGYLDQAMQRSHEALILAQELAHPLSLSLAFAFVALLHQLRREGQAAQEQTEECMALAREQGFASFSARATMILGWVLAEQGQGTAGIAQICQGVAALQATRQENEWPYYLALLAEAYGNVGRAEEGLSTVAEALAVADDTGVRFYEAELYRLKGQLTLQQFPGACEQVSEHSRVGMAHHDGPAAEAETVGGAHPPGEEEAEACFLRAVDIARTQQAKTLQLRAAISLARLWQRQGKTEEAHRMLGEIYSWFTEGFDTKDVQEARALLEALA
jgi:predicted ATPase